MATQNVASYFADRCFVSVKGVTPSGILTEADPLEAEIKRAMITRSTRATVLLERSKLSGRGLSHIARLADLSSVIAYGVPPDELDPLRAPGVSLRVIGPP
jgi:DeoR family transcriptional regulator of aga operon